MKISSKELEMKACQLINDRVMFNDKCSYPNGDKTGTMNLQQLVFKAKLDKMHSLSFAVIV
jgi:hypothetical protein